MSSVVRYYDPAAGARTRQAAKLVIEVEHRTEGEGRLTDVVALILQWIDEDAALVTTDEPLYTSARPAYTTSDR